MEKKILVLYTGGTIGMIQNPETGALEPFDMHDIYEQFPMLNHIDAKVSFAKLLPLIDSSDTNPQFWAKLASAIYDAYDQYDGFVVLHGTDTMSYTASALCYLLENLSKPVILTGSQLPLGVMRTDGRDNILNSIEIAATWRNGVPRVQEVCVYFQNALYRGNRTYKDNAEHFSAFMSANYPPLAEVGVKIKYNDPFIHIAEPNEKLILHQRMDENIAILKIYPGINLKMMEAVFNTEGLRAVILETYGAGNAPSHPQFLEILENAIQKGIIVVNVTQCKGGGTVEIGKYGASLHLGKIGVVSGQDMTTEAAVAKIMYLLGHNIDNELVKYHIVRPLRGELTVQYDL